MQNVGENQRAHCRAYNTKIENNEYKYVCFKNRSCYHFGDIIKFQDFSFDNILINGKSDGNILTYDVSYDTLIRTKLLRIRFDKIDELI